MSKQSRFLALTIEPNRGTRMVLKQATSAVDYFEKLRHVNDFKEALTLLEAGLEAFDIIFISHRFAQNEVLEFMNAGKEMSGGRTAAYIALMQEGMEEGSSFVAEGMMAGLDGFLMSPYSVDSLLELTRLAWKIKVEKSALRDKFAIAFLIGEIAKQVDRVAFLKKCEVSVGRSVKILRETCSTLSEFNEEKIKMYLEIAQDHFETAQIPERFGIHTKYKGASSQVKKREMKKAMKEIAKEEKALEKKMG